MPWTVADVESHKSGLSKKEKEKWIAVANNVLADCIKSGGDDKSCAPKAIKIANSQVGGEHDMEDELRYDFSVKKFEDVETEELAEGGLKLKGVPVFETGTHKGKDFTESDIDKIISQFNPDEDVPIQKNHSESVDDTLGYIAGLFRKAKMMFADMVLLDENAISRWKKKLMKKFSISILPNMKLREISAVAFPQVKTARVMAEHEEGKMPGMDKMPKMMICCDGTCEGTEMSIDGNKVKNLASVSFGADMGGEGMSNYMHCSYEEKKEEKNGFTSRKRYTYNPETKMAEEDPTGEKFENAKKNITKLAKTVEEDDIVSKELLEEAAEREKVLTKEIETLKTQLAAKDTEITTMKDKVKTDAVNMALSEIETLIAPAKKDEFKKILSEMSDESRSAFVKTMKETKPGLKLGEQGQVDSTKPVTKLADATVDGDARKTGIDENATIFSDASDLVTRAEKISKDENISFEDAYSKVLDKEEVKV